MLIRVQRYVNAHTYLKAHAHKYEAQAFADIHTYTYVRTVVHTCLQDNIRNNEVTENE